MSAQPSLSLGHITNWTFFQVSDAEELTPPEGLSALPPFSRCLIGIILRSPHIVR